MCLRAAQRNGHDTPPLPPRPGQPAPSEPASQAQFLAYRAQQLPVVEEVEPGVWSLPLPLVQLPIGYVLTYLLETPDGPVLVDAGWPDQASWDALGDGLAEIGYGVADLHGVILTHAHPDHHGLTERIRSASNAWVAAHGGDTAFDGDDDAAALERAEFADLIHHGMPEPNARFIAGEFASAQQVEGIRGPRPDLLVADGELMEVGGHDVVAVWTPGHTSGHLCLWIRDQRLLVSGDHVLPRISPGVGLNRRGGRGDPLGDYLESLRRVAALPIDEVLPAHEYRFGDLELRVDRLLAHHEHRLGEVRTVLSAGVPLHAWEIARRLTWSRPWGQIREWMQRAALFETVAHLIVLEKRGEVTAVAGAVRRWAAGPI